MFKSMSKSFRYRLIKDHIRTNFYFYAGKHNSYMETFRLVSNKETKELMLEKANKADKAMEFYLTLSKSIEETAITGGYAF